MMMRAFALDFDGVIADTNLTKSNWIRDHLNLNVPPWKCDKTSSLPIIGLQTYQRMADEVYDREPTMKTSPVPGAIASIRYLSTKWRLHCVTARKHIQAQWTIEWLEKQGILRLFCSVEAVDENPKSEVVARTNAIGLLDDDLRHLWHRPSSPILKLHLASYLRVPLSQDDDVTHVRNWKAVRKVMNRLVP